LSLLIDCALTQLPRKKPTAVPLTAGSKISDNIVCPAVRKKGPVVPVRTQRAVKQAMLLDKAQPTVPKPMMTVATRYAVRRPRMVDRGTQMSADRAMATRTPALARVTVVGVVSNVSAISTVTAMMDTLVNVMGRAIQHTTKRMTQRRQDGMSATTSSELVSTISSGAGVTKTGFWSSVFIFGSGTAAAEAGLGPRKRPSGAGEDGGEVRGVSATGGSMICFEVGGHQEPSYITSVYKSRKGSGKME
jgi:hypothetical protein